MTKDIISMAREAGLCMANDEWPLMQTFAAKIKAAHTDELLEGVEIPEPAYQHWGRGIEPVVGYTADQLRETVAAAVLREREAISQIYDAQEEMQSEIDALKAENERLTRQAFSIAVERDELRMELGDLPEAQAEMLTTVKQLKAENERLRADAVSEFVPQVLKRWIFHGPFADVASFNEEGLPSFYSKESFTKFKDGQLSTPCKGKNCGSLNGWLHSAECRAEHEAHYAVPPAAMKGQP